MKYVSKLGLNENDALLDVVAVVSLKPSNGFRGWATPVILILYI
jgi:hypothetical protein